MDFVDKKSPTFYRENVPTRLFNFVFPSLFFSKMRAISELVEIIFPVVKEGVKMFSNREIIRTVCECRKWLHAHVKPPCTDIVHCENLLSDLMKLSYDDFFHIYLNEVRNSEQVEIVLRALMNHVSFMS